MKAKPFMDSGLAAKLYPLRMTVQQAFNGRGDFTKWKAGERVLARKDGRTYTVRKARLKRYSCPLTASCCGVPKSHLAEIQ